MSMKKIVFFRLVLLVTGLTVVLSPLSGALIASGEPLSQRSTPAPAITTGFPQVVVVLGTDYEMGVQYGQQAAPAIFHSVAVLKSKMYDKYGSDTVAKDMKVYDYYIKKYDPTYQDWVQGIVEGCKQKGYNVSYYDIILLMNYPDEMWARPTVAYPAETGVKAAGDSSTEMPQLLAEDHSYHSCNSFAATGAATPDGKPIHGIVSMQRTELMDAVILIAFPKDGASFISATGVGRVNTNSAMNSYGFAWSMTAMYTKDSPAWGLDEAYFHYLAQVAKSPTEAREYIQSTPRGGVAGCFIMSDASGNLSVFETNAFATHLRKPGDLGESGPWVVQTNHNVASSMQVYNPDWLERNIGTYTRYNTVTQYLKEATPGTVDLTFAKKLFASTDWYDASTKQWHYNNPGGMIVSNTHSAVYQSIFFPADLTAYLQIGTPSGHGLPAYATGEYVKIKLGKNPKAVTYQADADALAFYWNAVDLLQRDLNAKAPYLTTSVIESIKGKLDQAFFNYSLGMNRSSFANLATDADKQTQMDLWSAALTYYAKAQLYAQMAKTMFLRAKGSQ